MSRKILFVVNHAGFFLSHRLPLAQAAQRAGYEVIIATPWSRHVPEIASAGLSWEPIRLSRSGIDPWSETRTLLGLYRLYRRHRPGLVHHVTSKPVLYGTPIARAAGVPAVVNAIAGMGHPFRRSGLLRSTLSLGYHLALRHPNMRVIFQNDAQLDLFVQHKWVKPEQTVVIRGSGVDTEVFAPPLVRPTGTPLVSLVSRMLVTKGIPEFVEAAKALHAAGVDARFALVGGPDPDNPASIAEEQLRRWHSEGLVEYWGRREDVANILRASAIACLPTYYPEGVPKSLIEAAACGLPIVTTDIPGCRDLVSDGETGFLVPARQVEPLVAALRTLLGDPDLRIRMGARGRGRVLADYSLAYVVAAHLRVYDELLA